MPWIFIKFTGEESGYSGGNEQGGTGDLEPATCAFDGTHQHRVESPIEEEFCE